MDPKGRDTLFHSPLYFDELNKNIRNGNTLGCADIFHKYISFARALAPHYQANHPGTPKISEISNFVQDLRKDSVANTTFPLQKVNAFLQSMANCYYNRYPYELTSESPEKC